MAEKKTDAPNPQPEKEPAEDAGADEGKLSLTQEELDAKIADAVKAAVKADRKAKAKKKPEADDDDGEGEDADELVRKAEQKAAEADQRAAEAEKKALLAEVKGRLTDWLGLNARDFIGNAPDIMLHIERQLSPGAKDGEVARLIEANAKAFIERTKAARKPASGAPVGGARNRVASLTGGTSDNADDRTAANAAANASTPARRPFSTLNFVG